MKVSCCTSIKRMWFMFVVNRVFDTERERDCGKDGIVM